MKVREIIIKTQFQDCVITVLEHLKNVTVRFDQRQGCIINESDYKKSKHFDVCSFFTNNNEEFGNYVEIQGFYRKDINTYYSVDITILI